MSDFSTRPAHEGKETGDSSSSDEGSSSSLRSDAGSQGRSSGSLWTRISRVLRPSQGDRLREDLSEALNTNTAVSAAFTPAERGMLNNILRFREVRIEDIMIPRADIDAIDSGMTIGEAMILFEETGRSRMPVYREKLDEPVGMIHIRDLLSHVGKQARNKRRGASAVSGDVMNFDLSRVDLEKTVAQAGVVRQILFVPPSMRAADLLQRMQSERTQIALVIDEYGGVDGLVSHEDIVEMVVGDIDDEHDRPETLIARVSQDAFIADARIELEDVVDAVGPDFDVSEQLEDVDTLGGLIVSSLGHIPAPGEVIEGVGGFTFEILDADARRIKRVRILRPAQASEVPLPSVVPLEDHGVVTGR